MIRTPLLSDIPQIYQLYKTVASIPGGLTRTEDEITQEYVQNFVEKSAHTGLELVLEHENMLVGEIHAYRSPLKVFHHIFMNLTICIHPDYQGRNLGKELFTSFLEQVQRNYLDILRVELIARQSNVRAIGLYKALGFKIEGEMRHRIRGMDGNYEADIPMAWCRDP